jgi:hypothetical protein
MPENDIPILPPFKTPANAKKPKPSAPILFSFEPYIRKH